TQRKIYQGNASGSPIREQHACYNGNWTNCETTAVSAPITSRYTYTTLESYQTNAVGEFWDSNSQLTRREEYDQHTTGTALQRVTVISYASLGPNIVDRPYQVTVQDNAGNTVSQATYFYD